MHRALLLIDTIDTYALTHAPNTNTRTSVLVRAYARNESKDYGFNQP